MGAVGRLLVIEDTLDFLDALNEWFTHAGYDVDCAEDGNTGIARFFEHRPDVVLLDLRLPDLPGEDVFMHLHRLDEQVPIVILSANDDVTLAKELLQVGAFDYVRKPADLELIERIVAAALADGAGRMRHRA